MIDHAIAALGDAAASPLAGIPTLLFDVPIENLCERDFVAALARRAPRALATIPAGDERSSELIARALEIDARSLVEAEPVSAEASSLMRLQHYLFAGTAPPERALDDTVKVFSAAGEMQECVEIAQHAFAAHEKHRLGTERVQHAAELDRNVAAAGDTNTARPTLAVGRPRLLRAHASRPEPGGRALLALLACAAENLSARRFSPNIFRWRRRRTRPRRGCAR
jgi:hypothetical protein